MRARNNSEVAGFQARADLESPDYVDRVARPVMDAIDNMHPAYRELVNEFGYVDVYRAWRRGIPIEVIRDRAKDGVFRL